MMCVMWTKKWPLASPFITVVKMKGLSDLDRLGAHGGLVEAKDTMS